MNKLLLGLFDGVCNLVFSGLLCFTIVLCAVPGFYAGLKLAIFLFS